MRNVTLLFADTLIEDGDLHRFELDGWHRAHCLEFTTTLRFGIDWTEEHRLHNLRKRYPS